MKQLAQSLADMFGATVGYTTATGARERATPTMKVTLTTHTTRGHEPADAGVRREIEVPRTASRGAIARQAKAALGWRGKRCVTTDFGDMIELRPYGECVVCFVSFN